MKIQLKKLLNLLENPRIPPRTLRVELKKLEISSFDQAMWQYIFSKLNAKKQSDKLTDNFSVLFDMFPYLVNEAKSMSRKGSSLSEAIALKMDADEKRAQMLLEIKQQSQLQDEKKVNQENMLTENMNVLTRALYLFQLKCPIPNNASTQQFLMVVSAISNTSSWREFTSQRLLADNQLEVLRQFLIRFIALYQANVEQFKAQDNFTTIDSHFMAKVHIAWLTQYNRLIENFKLDPNQPHSGDPAIHNHTNYTDSVIGEERAYPEIAAIKLN